MKILVNREVFTPPAPACYQYQILSFDDGSKEYDAFLTQTTAILTAELYNGKAAKNDAGEWIAAPGPRNHNDEYDILGFHVGLTLVGFDSDGKAIHDYTVITPTGVAFHGDGKGNTLHTPSNWPDERVALEILSWICIGEDSGVEFPEDTTPQQWEWIRSSEREYAAASIDDLLQIEDYGQRAERAEQSQLALPEIPKAVAIEEAAKMYQENYILACQTALVEYMLRRGDRVSHEEIANLNVDVASMDGYALATFIDEEMSQDWRDLGIVDIEEYAKPDEDGNEPDYVAAWADFNPLDLHEWDLEALREYITENYEPGEIFSWYLVDEWLAGQLAALGEATLTDDESHWWGRRTYGQMIMADGILQRIAAKHVE